MASTSKKRRFLKTLSGGCAGVTDSRLVVLDAGPIIHWDDLTLPVLVIP